MKINYNGRTILCDYCTETDGKLTLYQGGGPIMTIANIPDLAAYTAEDGEIEHVPTPLEAALEDINDLQADLAAAADEIAAEAEQIAQWKADYMELLADDEAKRARLERVQALLDSLGDSWTLTGLIAFVRALRDILAETPEPTEPEENDG